MGNTVEQGRASIGCWTRRQMVSASANCRDTSSSPWFQLLVVVILLIIGGIELNPGPIHSELCTYEKTKGFADMKGELYEIKMSALLFLRAVQTRQWFLLTSNMKAAGYFDDVVLTLGDTTLFLQLKHKEKSNTILRLSHLVHHKDFRLSRYLKSYLDIKQHWQDNPDLQRCGRFEDAKFVIFTNARIDENLVNAAGCAEFLNIVSTGGTCVCLTDLFNSLPKCKAVLSAAVSTENVTATPELWEVVHKLYSKQAQVLPSKRQLQEILEHLENLGDLTNYKQFISQLYLCAGQMTEKDLDHLISHEIVTCCGTETVLREFMDGVQNWWRNFNSHLTVKAKFFQDIIDTVVANITKDISALKVKFIENECGTVRQKLISGNRKIYLKTDCTNLSCIKVLQSFRQSVLVDVNTLQAHLSEVLAIWRLGVCDVLVVEGETTDISILQKLAHMPDSKCVVVISVNEQPQLYQEFKFASCIDTFCLNQLDLDSQRAILEHEVMFQGFPVKLNSLADVSFLQGAVTADTVVQLHNTLHIGHELHDLDPCYIPRTFLRREYVSEHIFREEHINIAVTGTSEDKLALSPIGEKVQKFHLSNNSNLGTACRYFLIEGEAEFTALCSVKNNIHWIEACEEGFLWKKSKGNMSPLIEHLEQKYVSYAGAEELVTLPHQMVLVDGMPGMGKSTEMCNIAHKIKQKDPSTWLIRVDLNKHTTLLSQNQIGAVEFLETVATLNTEFQKQLFEHQLESGGNVVILLDGFDEISPNYSKQVFDLLTKFTDSKVRKIFVTSRPITIKELQEKLSILAFSFQIFTPDEKKNFLIRHWHQIVEDTSNFSNFISSLLQFVETSLNDKLKEFIGIPLHCKMMVEVFQDEALHYCQTGEVRLPQSLNVLQLYDKFVEKKWQVYCKKLYGDVTNVILQILIDSQKLQYQKSVMCCALVSYFHDDDIGRLYKSEKVLKRSQKFVEMFRKGQDKSGIINAIVNNKTVFVHQTLTEYFVAMWFSKYLNFELHNMNHLYLDKNFDVVRKFLDRMLAQEMKLHTAVLNEDLLELRNLLSEENVDINQKDGGGRTALHLAIMNYFNIKNKIDNSIIETLLEHGADVNCEDKVLHWRPLRLAEQIRAWYVVDKLLKEQVDCKDLVLVNTDIKNQLCTQNPLQVSRREEDVIYDISGLSAEVIYTALSEGYANLLEFILNCGVSVTHYIYHSYDKSSMLHIAAEYGQVRLVQLLIERGAYLNDDKCWYNRTPLMRAAECGHVQIVELFINHGASVNARDEYDSTALLLTAREGQKKIVKLLLQKGADVEIHSLYNRTPLMQAAERGHVQIVELLINHGASVNATDKDGNTALLLAAHEGQNEIVELLLQKGADVEKSGSQCNITPLMQAAERGHVQIVELLMNHGASVNARDKDGNTALLLAAHEGQNEIVELLLQKGADVEKSGSQCNITPLMQAAERGHVQIVELLINHGASVNARDKGGNTALLLTVHMGIREMVELLLQNGADVDVSCGEYNTTPLMQAVECGHVRIVELLLNHGASVNVRDEYGDTALLLAVHKRKHIIVELLLQKGADVEMFGENKRTALMEASKCGHVQIAELLINYGASVNVRDEYGDTALLLAVHKGKHIIVELLLQKGADVEMSGENNRTALMEASKYGHVKIAVLLINHGASVNVRDEYGNTALLLAVHKGKHIIVELLLQKETDVEISDKYNRTPLMQAAMYGHVQIVELLINHGASVNARDKYGYTALLLTAYKGQNENVELLLQNGADVEISSGEDNITPLMQAAWCGHVKIAELLINHGASVNARDKYGNTALLIAAYKGQNEIVELLLQKRADVEISGGECNTTPLMQAAWCSHVQIVELLINHGASVNVRDEYGNTALLLAVHKRKHIIVELLLQKGADVEISDENNRTPLMEASKCGHVQIAELLINHGASVNVRDEYGDTALFLAARERKKEIVELLLQKGADVEMSDENNRTPLMEASKYGHVQIAELLINRGASVNARDKNGYTALLLAAYKGQNEIVELLLQKGADVEMSDENNRTALMEASKCGHVQIAELLINRGASVNARDKNGYTALLLAVCHEQNEIVELLLQKGADVEISYGDYDITPLMEAAEHGHMQIVELLINHGASVNVRDKDGNSALSLALNNNHNNIVQLLQHGAQK